MQIITDGEWDDALREMDESAMEEPPTTPPSPMYPTWGERGQRMAMCNARLDRARGAIRMTTGSDVAHYFGMRGQMMLPITEEMRFFVVIADNPSMRRRLRNRFWCDFSELPAPFLASTLREADVT